MKRRDFLRGSSALALAGAACGSPTAAVDGAALGPWGAPGAAGAGALLPPNKIPEGVVELFLLGGMTPWETLYAVPDFGRPDSSGPHAGTQWWTWQDPPFGTSLQEWIGKCAASPELLKPWATHPLGHTINLGPFVEPLFHRPDMLARMRVWVMRHGVEPHELSLPLTITGHRLGNPRMASLGAHIQRFSAERAAIGRTAPWSYTIATSAARPDDASNAAAATGLHRASARPLELWLGAEAPIRPRGVQPGWEAVHDALVDLYAARYRRRRVGDGWLVAPRAPGLGDFEFARQALRGYPALAALLPPTLFDAQDRELCFVHPLADAPWTSAPDETSTALRLAAHLLQAPLAPARYVQILDSGLVPDTAGMGYDAHRDHVERCGVNTVNAFRALASVVNEPGESDPQKLDLDRHLALVTCEFGRAPVPEFSPRAPDGSGSDHWPWGYVVVGFGGFIDEDRAGMVGSIGEDGRAIEGISPAEHRAALLLSLGIWPFTEQSFAVDDVPRGVETELEAALWLREHVLGYGS